MKKFISFPVHLVFPERCPACEKEFLLHSQPFCHHCMKLLSKLAEQKEEHCQVCAQPMHSTKENECLWCAEREVFFHRHFYIWSYQKVARTLLQSAKFLHRRKSISYLLKQSSPTIDKVITENNIQQVVYMVSSQKLVYRIKGKIDIPYYKNIFYKDKKIKNKELSRFDRFRAIDQTLKVDAKQVEKIKTGNILVVDDVRTTGASLHHACRLLVECGISKRNIFTLALLQQKTNNLQSFLKDIDLPKAA